MVRKNTARQIAPTDDGAWFAPKSYGYGSGLPIAWQGWAILLSYFMLVGGAAVGFLPHNVPGFVGIMLGATAVLLVICARKTRGGWKWRRGEDA